MPGSYEAVPILEKFPLQIQIGSIACYGKKFFFTRLKNGYIFQKEVYETRFVIYFFFMAMLL